MEAEGDERQAEMPWSRLLLETVADGVGVAVIVHRHQLLLCQATYTAAFSLWFDRLSATRGYAQRRVLVLFCGVVPGAALVTASPCSCRLALCSRFAYSSLPVLSVLSALAAFLARHVSR